MPIEAESGSMADASNEHARDERLRSRARTTFEKNEWMLPGTDGEGERGGEEEQSNKNGCLPG